MGGVQNDLGHRHPLRLVNGDGVRETNRELTSVANCTLKPKLTLRPIDWNNCVWFIVPKVFLNRRPCVDTDGNADEDAKRLIRLLLAWIRVFRPDNVEQTALGAVNNTAFSPDVLQDHQLAANA
jgi:hypothetical protein